MIFIDNSENCDLSVSNTAGFKQYNVTGRVIVSDEIEYIDVTLTGTGVTFGFIKALDSLFNTDLRIFDQTGVIKKFYDDRNSIMTTGPLYGKAPQPL